MLLIVKTVLPSKILIGPLNFLVNFNYFCGKIFPPTNFVQFPVFPNIVRFSIFSLVHHSDTLEKMTYKNPTFSKFNFINEIFLEKVFTIYVIQFFKTFKYFPKSRIQFKQLEGENIATNISNVL